MEPAAQELAEATSKPPFLYVHGGGWVLGNAGTHDRLVRELAVGAGAAVVFVEYDRSPEARYPVAIEQADATAQWITRTRTPPTPPSVRTWPGCRPRS
ncbi:alpha/beta hydrolase fold domain-containing protein [Nonomuraea sp. NPDC050153]|uniref:alpha/beta hydrolase fold domain-containing protein n=1 Tax=Nonomuraea sp. NPDC050153 TaxID=3364359 RepID=UPI0037B9F30B